MTAKMETFTVVVHVYEWMHSESEASKTMLLAYLEDIAESLSFRNHATACALASAPVLWFTFCAEEDANDFRTCIDKIYQIEGWSNGRAS